MFLLSSQKRTRVLHFFYLLTVFFLPTQLGKHFWLKESYVLGVRIDYLSPTLYLTDILIVVTVSFFILTYKNKIIRKLGEIKVNAWTVALLMLMTSFAASIFVAQRPILIWYGAFKFFEMTGFSLLTVFLLKDKVLMHKTYFAILTAMTVQSLVAVLQFVNQASLGGMLYLIGERSFTSLTPGIATGVFGGSLVLRSYGTLPHPNVLAGYLLLSIIITFCFSKALRLKMSLFLFFVWTLSSIAIILTLSRLVMVLGLLFWLVYIFRKALRKHLPQVALISILSFLVVAPFLYERFVGLTLASESIAIRQELTSLSVEMFGKAPVFGVGQYHFLVLLPEYLHAYKNVFFLQPVHSIYFLALSEWGALGVSAVFLTFYLFFKRIQNSIGPLKKELSVLFAVTLVIGFFDHYLFTLQQGQMLLAFCLGVVYTLSDKAFSFKNVKKYPKDREKEKRKKVKK